MQALVAGNVTERPDWCRWVEQNHSVIGELVPAYDGAAEPATFSNTAGTGLQ